jgi:hypothetical protein
LRIGTIEQYKIGTSLNNSLMFTSRLYLTRS